MADLETQNNSGAQQGQQKSVSSCSSFYADHPRRSLAEFADRVWLIGARHIWIPGEKTTVKRVLWTVVFVLFWALFAYGCVCEVNSYYLYQQETKQYDVFFDSLGFPAVTLCNLNPVRLSAFESSDLLHAGELYGILNDDLTLNEKVITPENPLFADIKSKTDFTDEDKEKSFNWEEFQLRAGHQLREMLKDCKWGIDTCSSDDFTPILTEMGLCYQFNVNKTWDANYQMFVHRRSYGAGQGYGLRMLLVTQENDYVPSLDKKFDTSLESGFKIQLHDPEVPPSVSEMGVGLAPGFQTFLAVEKEDSHYLAAPYGSCKDDEGYTGNYLKYSAPACMLECEADHVAEQCKCRLPYTPVASAVPDSNEICSVQTYLNCVKRTLDTLRGCDPSTCPTPCHMTEFKASPSFVRFPSSLGKLALKDQYGDLDAGQALVVSVFFQSPRERQIYQQPIQQLSTMLKNIGAMLVLLVGATAMTLFEFIFFLCDLIFLGKKRASGIELDSPSQKKAEL